MVPIIRVLLVGAYTAVIIRLLNVIFVKHEIIELNYKYRNPAAMKVAREIRKYGENASFVVDYKPPLRLPTDLKFILKYTKAFAHYSSSIFKNGQAAFIENNCTYINCFLTNDMHLLAGDIRNFDAVLFDVENDWDYHPYLRSPHQVYIFTASESADHYPICDQSFNNYYNLTWTYRLDSDIIWTYMMVLDKQGNAVGPRINMTWIEHMEPIKDEIKKKLLLKKRAAAWFVSNCFPKSDRNAVSRKINEELAKYGYGVDVYGRCGNLTCPRDRLEDCLVVLEEDYYFYFSFENSLSEDYVTEKLLYPLKHFAVPVVYGGANYSRFLPPGSYLDATEMDSKTIASLMVQAIQDKEVYYNYFKWHKYYTFTESPTVSDVCNLCKALNEYQGRRTVRNFTSWWYPCEKGTTPRPVIMYRDLEDW